LCLYTFCKIVFKNKTLLYKTTVFILLFTDSIMPNVLLSQTQVLVREIMKSILSKKDKTSSKIELEIVQKLLNVYTAIEKVKKTKSGNVDLNKKELQQLAREQNMASLEKGQEVPATFKLALYKYSKNSYYNLRVASLFKDVDNGQNGGGFILFDLIALPFKLVALLVCGLYLAAVSPYILYKALSDKMPDFLKKMKDAADNEFTKTVYLIYSSGVKDLKVKDSDQLKDYTYSYMTLLALVQDVLVNNGKNIDEIVALNARNALSTFGAFKLKNILDENAKKSCSTPIVWNNDTIHNCIDTMISHTVSNNAPQRILLDILKKAQQVLYRTHPRQQRVPTPTQKVPSPTKVKVHTPTEIKTPTLTQIKTPTPIKARVSTPLKVLAPMPLPTPVRSLARDSVSSMAQAEDSNPECERVQNPAYNRQSPPFDPNDPLCQGIKMIGTNKNRFYKSVKGKNGKYSWKPT